MLNRKYYYFIAAFFQILSSYIILPIFLNNVSLAEYGKYFIALAFSGFFSLLVVFGLTNVINAYYSYWKSKNLVYEIFTRLTVQIYLHFLIFLSFFFFINLFISILFDIDNYLTLAVLIFGFSQGMQSFFNTFLRFHDLALPFFISMLVFVCIEFLIKFYFLTRMEYSLESYLYVSCIPFLIVYLSMNIFMIFRYGIKYKFKKYALRVYYRYAFNMLKANIIGKSLSIIERPFIGFMFNPEVLGVYAIAHKYNSSIGTLRSMIKNIWLPDAVKNYKIKSMLATNKGFLNLISLVVLFALIVVPFYIDLFITQPLDSFFYFILAPLMSLNILWVFYYFHVVAIINSRKSKDMPLIQLISSIFYLISIFSSLIFGIYGIVFALYVQIFTIIVLTRYFYTNYIDTKQVLQKQTLIFTVLINIFGFILALINL